MLEPIKVRFRTLRGGNRRSGREYEWNEWQVVSGRAIVSRHDTEELANAAAVRLRHARETRVAAIKAHC